MWVSADKVLAIVFSGAEALFALICLYVWARSGSCQGQIWALATHSPPPSLESRQAASVCAPACFHKYAGLAALASRQPVSLALCSLESLITFARASPESIMARMVMAQCEKDG